VQLDAVRAAIFHVEVVLREKRLYLAPEVEKIKSLCWDGRGGGGLREYPGCERRHEEGARGTLETRESPMRPIRYALALPALAVAFTPASARARARRRLRAEDEEAEEDGDVPVPLPVNAACIAAMASSKSHGAHVRTANIDKRNATDVARAQVARGWALTVAAKAGSTAHVQVPSHGHGSEQRSHRPLNHAHTPSHTPRRPSSGPSSSSPPAASSASANRASSFSTHARASGRVSVPCEGEREVGRHDDAFDEPQQRGEVHGTRTHLVRVVPLLLLALLAGSGAAPGGGFPLHRWHRGGLGRGHRERCVPIQQEGVSGGEKPVGRKVEGLGTYSYKPLPLPEYDSEMRPLRRRDAVIPLLLLLPAAPPPAAARPPKKVRALPPPAFRDDPGSECEPEASDGSSLHNGETR